MADLPQNSADAPIAPGAGSSANKPATIPGKGPKDDGQDWRTRLIGLLLLLVPLLLIYLLIALWPRPQGSAADCQVPPRASARGVAGPPQRQPAKPAPARPPAAAAAGNAQGLGAASSVQAPPTGAGSSGEKPASMTAAQVASEVRRLQAAEEKKEQWLPCATIKPFGEFSLAADVRLLLLVLLAGSLGAYVHAAQSFAAYIGNQEFKRQWTWWYLLRVPTGAMLALFVYFTARGGLLTGTTPTSKTDDLNIFGIMSFAALAGLFSKQVIDKLAEVFTNFFKSEQDAKRKNKLGGDDAQASAQGAVAGGAPVGTGTHGGVAETTPPAPAS